MSKRPFVAATVAAVTLVAGLGAVAGPGAGRAAAATTARERTITVVGTGQVKGTPDVADLSIGVAGRASSAADALGTVSDRAGKVLGVLHDAGVSDADIQTTNLTIQPTYDRDHITGYEASNTVTARIRDLSKAGGIVDAAAAQAGDNIRLQGITFSIDDDSALLAAARAKAVKRARAQAGQLADAADIGVGDVLSIDESGSSMVPVTYAAPDAAKAGTPVSPGTETLSVTATVVFAIR